jgi:hypothetical protein
MRVSITNFLTACFLSSGRLPGAARPMQSSCRPASATSRPRSQFLVRVNARETSQTISTAVLLLVSELESALRLSELGARTPSWKRHGSRCGRHQRLLLGDRGSGCCSSRLVVRRVWDANYRPGRCFSRSNASRCLQRCCGGIWRQRDHRRQPWHKQINRSSYQFP